MTPQQLLGTAIAPPAEPPDLDLSDEIEIPDISHIEIEDDIPLDNFQSEKQQRLLVEPLYSADILPQPFLAAANVGIFGSLVETGIAPDVFLSLGVQMPADWSQKANRSYFVWQFGKFPDVVIELVSNRKGNELAALEPEKRSKKAAYARLGIPYYAVFDPLQQIQDQMGETVLRVFVLTGRNYVELPAPFWLAEIGLGLTVWQGDFEAKSDQWLRWCDQQGQVIPTGKERADQANQRANQADQRADQADQRADQAEAKARRLAARLQALGIDPDDL
jgi:Uma2 family endonuclease